MKVGLSEFVLAWDERASERGCENPPYFQIGVASVRNQTSAGDTRCADVWCTASSVGSQGVLRRRLLALAARKPAARTATSANPLPCEAG